MNKTHAIKALLLMGGSGERFGSELPKQFHRISGKKIYLHTLEKFLAIDLFEEILLICPERWREEVEKDLLLYPKNRIRIVLGGKTRQESSYCGLMACGAKTHYVVIHDAVRPFVSRETLLENIQGAIAFQAVDTCIPSADTLVHAPQGKEISTIPPRAEYLRGQTPQSFAYPVILDAHKLALSRNIVNASDDCRLVLEMGHKVYIVPGDEHNLKITTELDLFLAEQLFRLGKGATALDPERTSLAGKRFALIGGTGAIGQAITQLLEKENAHVLLLSRGSSSHSTNLSSAESIEKSLGAIHEQYGPLDGLINCAGIFQKKPLLHLSLEEIEALIRVNLTGAILSCKYGKIKPGGHIINIASSSYSRGRKDSTVYAAAKAALVNFTQGLAEEWPEMLINTIAPQRTRSQMRAHHFPEENPEEQLGPEEVAEAVIDLLRQKSLTGAIIEVKKK